MKITIDKNSIISFKTPKRAPSLVLAKDRGYTPTTMSSSLEDWPTPTEEENAIATTPEGWHFFGHGPVGKQNESSLGHNDIIAWYEGVWDRGKACGFARTEYLYAIRKGSSLAVELKLEEPSEFDKAKAACGPNWHFFGFGPVEKDRTKSTPDISCWSEKHAAWNILYNGNEPDFIYAVRRGSEVAFELGLEARPAAPCVAAVPNGWIYAGHAPIKGRTASSPLSHDIMTWDGAEWEPSKAGYRGNERGLSYAVRRGSCVAIDAGLHVLTEDEKASHKQVPAGWSFYGAGPIDGATRAGLSKDIRNWWDNRWYEGARDGCTKGLPYIVRLGSQLAKDLGIPDTSAAERMFPFEPVGAYVEVDGRIYHKSGSVMGAVSNADILKALNNAL